MSATTLIAVYVAAEAALTLYGWRAAALAAGGVLLLAATASAALAVPL